jgi:diketogulonate reductase-like aldo/keto reductase
MPMGSQQAAGYYTQTRIKLMSNLAKKYHKTDAQIILNWLVSKKNVVAI